MKAACSCDFLEDKCCLHHRIAAAATQFNSTASAKYESQAIDFTWLFCFLASSVCHLVCHQTSAVAGCCEMELDAKRHTCEMCWSAAHSLPIDVSTSSFSSKTGPNDHLHTKSAHYAQLDRSFSPQHWSLGLNANSTTQATPLMFRCEVTRSTVPPQLALLWWFIHVFKLCFADSF